MVILVSLTPSAAFWSISVGVGGDLGFLEYLTLQHCPQNLFIFALRNISTIRVSITWVGKLLMYTCDIVVDRDHT